MSGIGPEIPRRNPVSGRFQFAGRPLPVPPWATMVAGGGIAGAIAPMAMRRAIEAGPEGIAGCALLGAATGALAGMALGRVERRIVLFAAALGVAAGLLLFLAAIVHGSIGLAGFVVLAGLPAATMAFALRLGRSDTVTLCALSLTYLAVGTCVVIVLVYVGTRVTGVKGAPVDMGVAGVVGALAWLKPAGVRIVGPGKPPRPH